MPGSCGAGIIGAGSEAPALCYDPAAVRIRVLAFATASDALGGSEREVEIREGASVADLKRLLERDRPGLAALWPRIALAVDERLAGDAHILEDGAEVALLPPVSGGSGGPALLVDGPIDVAALVTSVSQLSCGAVLLFLGNVRDHHAGRPVTGITYHAYRSMAERRLAALVADLESADPELAVGVVHRLGELRAGETSVAIAVASPHREVAYEASRTALERLKREVPIWKRELYTDGDARWREEEPLGSG